MKNGLPMFLDHVLFVEFNAGGRKLSAIHFSDEADGIFSVIRSAIGKEPSAIQVTLF